ncbi:MAG: TraM recognition domain-containing protein [Clostridia bacterium]
MAIQSFGQLEEKYGKEGAQNILDNATLIYLKSNSVETATKISDKLRSIFSTKLW